MQAYTRLRPTRLSGISHREHHPRPYNEADPESLYHYGVFDYPNKLIQQLLQHIEFPNDCRRYNLGRLGQHLREPERRRPSSSKCAVKDRRRIWHRFLIFDHFHSELTALFNSDYDPGCVLDYDGHHNLHAACSHVTSVQ
ncbi:Uu.00g074860.m01.CDS01 [Anthostomella pinea]|uniref:Uu.00g074860.m01.CDS01 n=1 Tax=Anthostomella pinea TaxID=933095 RepID=A0AAI8VPX2_9PEZI|nr:Uu.00g074860.m01.CDS01 [Anthostomella pinea]